MSFGVLRHKVAPQTMQEHILQHPYMDNKLKIVSYLAKNQDRLFTMHELSKLVDIPYASFYRTIFKMKDILEIKNLGKSKIVQLYTANRIIQAYLSIASEEEKKEFSKKMY